MRPLILTMQAFGPFADVQTLDFKDLGERQFFLIHGPTGAGKTTILDAMCFALYGTSSGAEREGSAMRSDHADPATPTDVTFDFAIGPQHYRVQRRPKQDRPKKRGGGFTTDEPQAALWKWAVEADGNQRLDLLAGQWERCTQAVEDILGFKSPQFRQVVMLPQGQFRQLLAADSRERQKIMETLFHTEQYRIMEERLKEKAKDLENDVKDCRRRIDLVLAQAEATDMAALAAAKQALESAFLAREDVIDKARQEEGLAQTAVNDGARIIERLEECRTAQKEVDSLEAQKAAFAGKRLLLETGRRALTLLDVEETLKTRRHEQQDLTQAVAAAEAQLQAADEAAKQAEENLRKEQAREPEREAILRTQNELTGFKGRVADLDRARDALKQADKDLQSREIGRRKAQDVLASLRKSLEEKTQGQTQAAALAAQEPALAIAHDEAQKRDQQRRQYEEAKSSLAAGQKQYHAAVTRRQEAEEVIAKQRAELTAAEQLWQAGQAAVLAGTLMAGEPCPVCGSREHPTPAAAKAALPKEESLRKIRRQLEKMEKDLSALRDEEVKIGLELERHRANALLLRASLGEAADLPPDQLADRVVEGAKALALSREAQDQLKQTIQEIENLKTKEVQSVRTTEAADQACQAAIIEREKRSVVVAEREAAIPETWRDASALEEEIKRVAARADALKAAFSSAQEKNLRYREARSAAEATWTAKTAALSTAAENLNRADEDFRKRLADAGFPDEATFQDVKRGPEELRQLDDEIQAFDRAGKSAVDRLERAEQAAAGLVAPDLEALSTALQNVKDRLAALMTQQAQQSARIKWLDTAQKNIADYTARLDELEARYAVFGRIAEVANGKNLYGMTFQRFVLAALLDDVLTATSARLKIMSRGRYELHRVRDKSKRPSGLELEVYDAYTGALRGVATLSGGESFLASLSLALGLADVVQSYAGGIRLDTIFIDEGFGSLDPEALEQAMRALIDLQRGGRLVGVISHVPEMKEWIGARLEITSGRRGSRAKFVF